jgi:hypothetical protein
MSTKRYSVRRESEADMKRHVKCIFGEREESSAFSWSDRDCCAVLPGTVICVTYLRGDRMGPARSAAPADEVNGLGCARCGVALRFLPQYAPHLNRIEMQFGNLVAAVRAPGTDCQIEFQLVRLIDLVA